MMSQFHSRTVALARTSLASARADLDDAVQSIPDSEGQTVVASSDIMGLLLRVVAARRHLESVERIPDRRRASADTLSARAPCPDR